MSGVSVGGGTRARSDPEPLPARTTEAGPARPSAIAQVTDVGAQLRQEVERSFERALRGIDVVLGRNEPDVALTPKDVIYSQGTLRLYRYRPVADEVYRVPVVLVMSLISKPYILDLVPGQSFVEYLVQQGFDVYMIDWGVPRPEDHVLKMEDYVLDRMPRCLEVVQRITKQEDFSLIGYCMGGMFGLLYGAAFPRAHLKNLICIATPVDYTGLGLLRRWADPQWFDVDRIVEAYGNIPADMIRMSLEMLRPLDRFISYIRLWDSMWNEEYVYNWRIRYRWAQDQIPFPGECFRQMTKDLMRDNKLMTGEYTLAGRRIDPGVLDCSVLNAMAEFDHIAPYASTRPLTTIVGGSDKQDLTVRGGHVSLIAGERARQRLWPTVNDWLSVRSV